MLTNDIKEGMPIQLTYGRVGTMKDNKKGIIRTVEVEVPGQGFDVGSCYINEIIMVKVDERWQPTEIVAAHKKQLEKIGW